MSSISQPARTAELPPTTKPQLEADTGPAAQAAAQRKTEHLASLRDDVLPDVLQVSLDTSAGRFVQVLTDVDTEETLRRYPSEGQLAYSRAVMAYMRALTES